VALLWPAGLLVGRLAGPFAETLTVSVLALVVLAQMALPVPAPRLEPVEQVRFFDRPDERVRHTVELPISSPGWANMWARTPAPRAFVYALIAAPHEAPEPSLDVWLDGTVIGSLPDGAPQATPVHDVDRAVDVAWYRLPVGRAALNAGRRHEIVIAPRSQAWRGPASVGVAGGYSFRSTVRPYPSAFFDGTAWSSAPLAVLPEDGDAAASDSGRGPYRYHVEIRIVDQADGRFLAMYY
jgi:hypothetical protein